MRWTRMLVGASLLALCVGTAGAQLNLLTPREVVRVVGMIPEVAESRKQGFCPTFSLTYGYVLTRASVQVRHGCGPYAGQLINNYEVDLQTGAIVQLETKQSIKAPEAAALAKVLLKQAEARVLSPDEARCLALEAAKSLPGWGGAGHDVSVEPFGAFSVWFHARLRTQDPPMVTSRSLTVDRSTAIVHDDQTGMNIMSPGLASLASKMLALHLPSLLSEADAVKIAEQIPEVRAQAQKPCSVFSVGGPLSWEEILVGVQSHCEGAPEASTVLVAVNPETGNVTDPKNQKHFGSPAAARTARERLDALDREKMAIRNDLSVACHPQ